MFLTYYGITLYINICYIYTNNHDSICIVDIRKLNDIAMLADKSGMIILGGGVIKHQICNANLMRNGADYSVYINTGIEHDGSDSGASPDEAISWGKIKMNAKPVKLYGEASMIFPLIIAQTFAQNHPNSPSYVQDNVTEMQPPVAQDSIDSNQKRRIKTS